MVITVTNENEPGTVVLTPMAANVDGEIMARLTDIDGGVTDVTWQWSRSDMMDGTGTFEDIEEDAKEDSYMPVEADEGMYLKATATYTDGYGSGKMESAVTTAPVAVTMDNPGSVSITPRLVVVGQELTAILSDADTATGETWQWSSSNARAGTFADISGARAATYTPVEADVGMYLKATASYSDGYSSNRMAEGVTAAMVIAEADAPVDTCIELLGALTAPQTVMAAWADDCAS